MAEVDGNPISTSTRWYVRVSVNSILNRTQAYTQASLIYAAARM